MSLDSTILKDFADESKQLLKELETVVERLEVATGTFPEELLTEFAQKIDRIMGAAKTLQLMDPSHLGLASIGKLAELCKSIGYKAAEKKNLSLMPFFAAFWAETIETIDELLDQLQNLARTREIAESFPKVLQNRLAWLKARIEK